MSNCPTWGPRPFPIYGFPEISRDFPGFPRISRDFPPLPYFQNGAQKHCLRHKNPCTKISWIFNGFSGQNQCQILDVFNTFLKISILQKLAFRLDGSMIFQVWTLQKGLGNHLENHIENKLEKILKFHLIFPLFWPLLSTPGSLGTTFWAYKINLFAMRGLK